MAGRDERHRVGAPRGTSGYEPRQIERAVVESRNMEYLYKRRRQLRVHGQGNFEQLNRPDEFLEGQAGYLIPNIDVQVNFHQRPPEFSVRSSERDADGGRDGTTLKGGTAKDRSSPRRWTPASPNGAAFVTDGVKIKVNTDTGEYIERA